MKKKTLKKIIKDLKISNKQNHILINNLIKENHILKLKEEQNLLLIKIRKNASIFNNLDYNDSRYKKLQKKLFNMVKYDNILTKQIKGNFND